MKSPITKLTHTDVQVLRRKTYGTNGKEISISYEEVKDMKKHLENLYKSNKVQMNFAEKIVYMNKIH